MTYKDLFKSKEEKAAALKTNPAEAPKEVSAAAKPKKDAALKS